MVNNLSLCEYLAESGGLRMVRNGRPTDGAGDLRAMGAPWWHMGRSFRRKLCRDDSGLCPDAAALAAWEAGYFPGHAARPDLGEFLEAVRRDIATGEVLAGFEAGGWTLEPPEQAKPPSLPPKPAGAMVEQRGGLLAYLYEQRGAMIHGRYVGRALAGLLGHAISKPYRVDAYSTHDGKPAWSAAYGTAGERDAAARGYLDAVPF